MRTHYYYFQSLAALKNTLSLRPLHKNNYWSNILSYLLSLMHLHFQLLSLHQCSHTHNLIFLQQHFWLKKDFVMDSFRKLCQNLIQCENSGASQISSDMFDKDLTVL